MQGEEGRGWFVLEAGHEVTEMPQMPLLRRGGLPGLIATVLWEIRAGEGRDDYEGNGLL